MSATSAISALCDQPGRELREALLRYVKANPQAPYSMQADSMLYGDLIRHYLQWCAGLLTKIEEASASRPASQAAVTYLLERAAAYFQDTARWPSMPQLDHPLRLLLPACYATRAAQRLNSLLEPALLAVDFTEPNEFVVEILGQTTFEEISHHKNEDFKSFERITEDPSGQVAPLHYRMFLHAGQRARLMKARAAIQEPPKVATPPPDPPPAATVDRDTALTLSWSLELSGTRITLEQTNSFDPGYGGGSSYLSRERFLELCRGHRYRLLEIGFTSGVSYAGLNLPPRELRKESTGEWKIHVREGVATLVLTGDNGSANNYRIEKVGMDAVKLDGRDRAWAAL